MEKKYITKSYKETQKLGEDFALGLYSWQAKEIKNRKTAIVLGLQGDLGGGKTTFLQGFAKGLRIKKKILSPTFVILKRFEIKNQNLKFTNFYHIDCYRLKNTKDILELDFKEIIKNPQNIVAIEWPERIKKALPKNIIIIKFKFIYPEHSRRVDKNKREIVFKRGG